VSEARAHVLALLYMPTSETKRLTVDLPMTLYAAARLHALDQDVTLTATVERLLRAWIEADGHGASR
jgi:hypothetical protein